MTTIYVDGRAYEANPEQNLLHACLSLGFDLPYFCWHPALGSVGACRQCAVKQFRNEEDRQGKLVMACMTAASEGTRISIQDPEAQEFRRLVIEGLMLHHPHDCPVCDEGGECHLQDMTVMTGHNYRRSTFPKRTFRNQDLGPFVNHEMNRCIQCYRCVRFYRDYAGGRDFDAFHLRDTVFFGRHQDGPLENEFAGNLVEVCPTGVFTDKTLKPHYTRKWDLQMAPSVCVHCGMGCNISVGERYGQVRRIVNRYNHEINGYFLCDRGRFGYEFVNGPQRLLQPGMGRRDRRQEVSQGAALGQIHEALRAAREAGRPVIGIGSPRASLESNFALRKLVGEDRFFAGIPERELRTIRRMIEVMRTSPARIASLRDVETCDSVLILGEDIASNAPRMALSVQQALRNEPAREAAALKIPSWNDAAVREVMQGRRGPLFIASVQATRLDHLGCTAHAAPADLARLGCAVAHYVDDQAPAPGGLPDHLAAFAKRAAAALQAARRPLVICGAGCRSEQIVEAAGNIATALMQAGRDAHLAFAAAECNSAGLAEMAAGSLNGALAMAKHPERPVVVILENDLYKREPAAALEELFEQAGYVISLEHSASETTRRSDAVLPAATFAEGSGTLVNNEMRAQRFFRAMPAPAPVRESWRWIGQILGQLRPDGAPVWDTLDGIVHALAATLPALHAIRDAVPLSGYRIAGSKIPRQPHRASGRTAMLAQISVHEPKPPEDRDSPLAFSMEGATRHPPPGLTPFFWEPGWNSIQAVNQYQREIGEALRGGSPGVRLFEAQRGEAPQYANDIPEAFAARPQEWLLVPRYQIFGSEELSRLSEAVGESMGEPHIWLSPEDLGRLGVRPGELVGVAQNSTRFELTAAADETLPSGVAGIPVGLTETLDLPVWSKLKKS